jgi:hypothetical protein
MRTRNLRASPDENLFKYQDEQFAVIEIDNGETVVLSSLDNLSMGEGKTIIHSDYTSKTWMRIYAESLTLSGTYKTQNSLISTCNISSVPVKDVIIDTSGTDGITPDPSKAKPGEKVNGTNGKPGGNNYIFIENFPMSGFSVHLHSIGGAGGNAGGSPSCSQGGDGGDGSNGGHIEIRIINSYKQVSTILYNAYTANDTDLLTRMDAFKTIAGFQEQIINEILTDSLNDLYINLGFSIKSDDLNKMIDDLTNELLDLPQSQRQQTCKKINTTLLEIESEVVPLKNLLETSVIASNTNVSGGHGGTYGQGIIPGHNGSNGNSGTALISGFSSISTALSAAAKDKSFPIVHPDQCLMLLQKAKMLYFAADVVTNPDGFRDAAIILKRLYERTFTFDSNQDVINYYKDNEALLGTYDSINTLQNIYQESKTFLNQLKNGLDYYGYKDNYVPLASFSFYQESVDKLLNNLEKIENSYHDYFNNLNDQDKALASFKDARNQADRTIQESEYKKEILINMAGQTVIAIDAYEIKMQAQKQFFLNEINDFKDKIENASGFKLNDLFSAISMCAFCPESGLLVASEAGQVIYNSAETIDCGPTGEHIDKKYIVNKLKSCAADYQSLKEGYQQISDGHLEPDDPQANKLLVQKQELDRFLEDFYETFPDDIKEIKEAFQDYFNIVLERNNKIINYNSIVNLIINYNNQIKSNKDKIQALNDQELKNIKPELPALTTFVSKVYHEARSQVLQELYLAAKAYRFWALSDRNLLSQAIGSTPVSDITSLILLNVQSAIITGYTDAVQEKGRDSQKFPANPDEKGVIYNFPLKKLPDYINQLRKDNEIYFNIDKVDNKTSIKQSAFAGFADIRLLKVRPWIIGAKTSNNLLQVEIIHEGHEEIVNRSGIPFYYEHDRVTTKFIYHLDTNEIFEDGDLGMKEINSVYAQIGPFTGWHLIVDPNYNDGLDLSGVTDIQIEFHGTNYSFNR